MNLFSQKNTISFPSSDGLLIHADLYENDPKNPWIVLLHQANYSRGEYLETAPKLLKLGFNCLAVDLRSGGEANYIQNLTYSEAVAKNLPVLYSNSIPDIQASIDFAYKKSGRSIILFGSSYSASLALMEGKKNDKIWAVIAFSPGEYFGEDGTVRNAIEGFDKPAFITSSSSENSYLKPLLSQTNLNQITVYKPTKGKGIHGSRALWENNPNHEEYWLALMFFLGKFK